MKSWFNEPGAYVLVDGQYGSTGKGLLAAYMAEFMVGKVNKITTNAGPNSGHTAYYALPFGALNDQEWAGPIRFSWEKIVTQQLPVASVFLDKMGHVHDTIINAGAIIDYGILMDELAKWCNAPGSRVLIHPLAALITNADRERDKVNVAGIASTGKGVGPAMMMKLARQKYVDDAVAKKLFSVTPPNGYASWDNMWDWNNDVVFVETAQGFSLGLNSARFYPNVTSRECTVMQALADARIPAQALRKVVATYRTYPIRVGSTENSSGDCYPDQTEIKWEDIGVPAELTTVTKRVRRVFTWSNTQFYEGLLTNRPDAIFLNFCNYLSREDLKTRVNSMRTIYFAAMGKQPEHFLLGFGPYCSDIIDADEHFYGAKATDGRVNG